MTTYGFEVQWTKFGGAVTRVGVANVATREQAVAEAFLFAAANGWTPPRWWQWWRWKDTRKPKETTQ